MISAGPILGWLKEHFWCVRKSVAPAKGVYSPPLREVGIVTIGIWGDLIVDRSGLDEAPACSLDRASSVKAEFAAA